MERVVVVGELVVVTRAGGRGLRALPPPQAVRAAGALWLLLAVVVSVRTGWGGAPWWAPVLLALAVAGAEVAVVHLQFGRQRWTFSLTEAALAAALVAHTGAWVVAGVTVGAGAAQLVRAQPRLKVQYNVAQFALSAAGAAAAATALGGGFPGAVVGLAAFFGLNHSLIGLAVALMSDQRWTRLVLSSAPLSALHAAGNASLGLLAVHLAVTSPVGLLGLVVPLALLWSSYEQQTRRTGEARLFEELARGQEQATARSTDTSAQVVLTAAARLFGGADVEMVLLAAEGPVRYAGDETGVPQRLRVDPDAFDEPWVLRALGERGVSSGVEDGRPWCSAVLGPRDAPLAVLLARRSAGSAAFGRQETRLAQVLVGQAESWLSIADLSSRHTSAAKALGDLGADTAPALALLRDSADRLGRLALRDGGIESVVEELHLVERAVASLLGAVALAAEPDLLLPTRRATDLPARPTADWTTTGVFR
ncbi:MAG: hypothetical protein JWN17_878 [Frankiales bacterium]|nr:hypothetical protein [Frankiales bacterium]